ncbi:MAG: ATP-binding protein [archaeon]
MDAYYEKLDFDEDPFTTNPKKFNKVLFGMEDALSEAFYRIDSGNLLVIEGKEGIGKTSLLVNVIKKYGGKGKVIYVDCEKLEKKLNITHLLQSKYGVVGRILNKKPKDMILLLDNVQEMSKINNDRIKYYFDQNYLKSVIFTTTNYARAKFSDSLRDRIGKRVIRLKDLNEEQAVELIRNRIGESQILTDELIVEIFKKSGKNTKMMLENCRLLGEHIAKNNRDRIKYIDIQKMLGEKNE